MDCVLSYHLNPLTCGVAKFNLTLARRFCIPMLGVFDAEALNYQRPLLSVKISEFNNPNGIDALNKWLDIIEPRQSLRLFLHEFSNTAIEVKMLQQAKAVYCSNSELAARLYDVRPDLVELWCPGTLLDARRFNNTALSLFSFGMAHKVRTDHYHKLSKLLDQTGSSYCLYLSTALHDGTSFDGSFTTAFEELCEIFGSNVYFMGYLSDTAIYNYLSETTFFAAFFEKGIRANNTSVNLAMQCGSVVITNLDQFSPPSFVHLDNILDIRQCKTLPTEPHLLSQISARAKETAHKLGWDEFTRILSENETVTR